MTKTRFENFSDALIAIIMTIMALRMKAPIDGDFQSLLANKPIFMSYVMSFVVVSIFWVSHNQLFLDVEKINRKMVWANLHLLFWMSLIPLVMAFMGEHHKEPWPVAAYALVFGMTYFAFTLLRKEVLRQSGHSASEQHSLMFKQNIFAGVLYFISIPMAFVSVYIPYGLFALIPLSFFLVKKSSPN